MKLSLIIIVLACGLSFAGCASQAHQDYLAGKQGAADARAEIAREKAEKP